jgi:hypothetical protein
VLVLQIAIQQGALMLERFYPSHVLQRLPVNEEDFWESKGLPVNDWAGLAGLMYADIFSLDFLTPLDDTDTRFRLEVCFCLVYRICFCFMNLNISHSVFLVEFITPSISSAS